MLEGATSIFEKKFSFPIVPSFSPLVMTFGSSRAQRRPWAQELTCTEVTRGHLSLPGFFVCTDRTLMAY